MLMGSKNPQDLGWSCCSQSNEVAMVTAERCLAGAGCRVKEQSLGAPQLYLSVDQDG